VFERFTEPARQVVVLAQDEARTLNHNYIGTEHLLLGLLREEDGLGARVLQSLGITLGEVRAQVARIVGQGEIVSPGQIPFTPRAKKVLELSMREALALGHNYIGTEHILLGLMSENEGVACRILLDFDADADKIRGEVIRLLGGPAVFGTEAVAAAGGSTVERDVMPLRPYPRRRRFGSMPKGSIDYGAQSGPSMLLGWLLFGVALAIGILFGWLIWG
jgi:ATP-dependent Clp protease ATP-binding subunit ClpC